MIDKTQQLERPIYFPPPALQRFVRVLLSEESDGNKLEAERISGVPRQKFYWAMRSNADFRQWYSEQVDHFLEINEDGPARALLTSCKKGNPLSLRTYFEIRKKLKPPVTNLTKNTQVNVIQHLHRLASAESPAAVGTQVVDAQPIAAHTNGSNGSHPESGGRLEIIE